MTVTIVVHGEEHEYENIIGVYASKESAVKRIEECVSEKPPKDKWRFTRHVDDVWRREVYQPTVCGSDHMHWVATGEYFTIYEWEVRP